MNAENHRTTRGAARLRSLKEAAAEMFLDQGYEAVSLDTLIARVGGSRRNIYDNFGGKEGLFIEAITEMCAELSEPLWDWKISGRDERTALRNFGARVLDVVLHPQAIALHRLMIAEGHRHPKVAQAIYRAGHDKAGHTLGGWVEAMQVAGRLRKDVAARELADQFLNMLVTGPQLRALIATGPNSTSFPEKLFFIKNVVDTFLTGAMKDAGKMK